MGFALGATEYLVKPVSREVLLKTVQKYLPALDSGKILVVDDEVQTLQLIAEILRSGGHFPILAESGQEAVRMLGETQVSAVILDLLMPNMNGFEFLHLIREQKQFASLPVIVLTAKELSAEDLGRLRGKVSACLQKGPAWKTRLLDQIRISLNSSALKA